MARRLTERDVVADGIRIHLVEAGEGPALILLHGLTASHFTWEHTIPAFADRWRVIAPDLPGHGRSDKPDAPYTIDFYAGVIRSLARALDVEEAFVVGNSLGGQIAVDERLLHVERAREAADHTRVEVDRVRRVGLVGPPVPRKIGCDHPPPIGEGGDGVLPREVRGREPMEEKERGTLPRLDEVDPDAVRDDVPRDQPSSHRFMACTRVSATRSTLRIASRQRSRAAGARPARRRSSAAWRRAAAASASAAPRRTPA